MIRAAAFRYHPGQCHGQRKEEAEAIELPDNGRAAWEVPEGRVLDMLAREVAAHGGADYTDELVVGVRIYDKSAVPQNDTQSNTIS